jgi:predicted Rossmann-fold nucleotide-binding protein
MHFLVHNQYSGMKRLIILFNIDGYWDHLMAQFKVMVKEKALREEHFNFIKPVTSVNELKEILLKELN